jgi:tetratricopeptide (TPR) repeat protein
MKRLAIMALLATLAYPAMMVFYLWTPEKAIVFYQGLLWLAKVAGLCGAVLFGILALFYPPFLEHLRRARRRLMRRVTTNWHEIQNMEERMASAPTPGGAWKLGHAYFEIEDYARAAAWYEQGIGQDPAPPVSVQFRLGIACLALGRLDKAQAAFQTVHQRDPHHASEEILLRLGETASRLGDTVATRTYFESFEKYSGGTPELHYLFGCLEESLGNRTAARERMRKAVALYSKLPSHARNAQRIYAARARWFLFTRWAGRHRESTG